MALRDFGAPRQLELRPAAVLAPTAKPRREAFSRAMPYLPGSCGQVDRPQTWHVRFEQRQEAAVGEWLGVLIAIVSSASAAPPRR